MSARCRDCDASVAAGLWLCAECTLRHKTGQAPVVTSARCRHCGGEVPVGYHGCRACNELPYRQQVWRART